MDSLKEIETQLVTNENMIYKYISKIDLLKADIELIKKDLKILKEEYFVLNKKWAVAIDVSKDE